MATTTSSTLPAKLGALLELVQTSFREWPHTGRAFLYDLAVSNLAKSECDVLMAELVARGFVVCELKLGTIPLQIMLTIERRAAPLKEETTPAANLHAMVEHVQLAFRKWNMAEPRTGQTFKHTIAGIARARTGVCAALSVLLRASGFIVAVRAANAGDGEEYDAIDAWREGEVSPVQARIDRLQGEFREWGNSPERCTNRLFIREFGVDDLAQDERFVLMRALADAGFDAREIAYKTGTPQVAFRVERTEPVRIIGASTPPRVSEPIAVTLAEQKNVALLVDEANRQFNQWLLASNCHPTDSFASPVHATGLTDAGLALFKRLLRGNDFCVRHAADADPHVFHIRRSTSKRVTHDV